MTEKICKMAKWLVIVINSADMTKCLSVNVNNKIEQTSPVQDHTTMVKLTRWISEPSNIFSIH